MCIIQPLKSGHRSKFIRTPLTSLIKLFPNVSCVKRAPLYSSTPHIWVCVTYPHRATGQELGFLVESEGNFLLSFQMVDNFETPDRLNLNKERHF